MKIIVEGIDGLPLAIDMTSNQEATEKIEKINHRVNQLDLNDNTTNNSSKINGYLICTQNTVQP